ncbi:MAG: hypothetical protein WDO73_12970 [Ignavibacteriota bacterium]
MRGVSFDSRPVGTQPVVAVTATYTMQSERAVHESLYDAVPHDPDSPPASVATASDDDNVEFF